MNKELAEEITKISVEEQKMLDRKYEILKTNGHYNWESLKTLAMKFLLENK